MDAFAVKQACRFAKEHALKNGPIVSLSIYFSIFKCSVFPFVVCHILCEFTLNNIFSHSIFGVYIPLVPMCGLELNSNI